LYLHLSDAAILGVDPVALNAGGQEEFHADGTSYDDGARLLASSFRVTMDLR
jgi:hypothetical protein